MSAIDLPWGANYPVLCCIREPISGVVAHAPVYQNTVN
jgi:hypothetical protein